MALFEINRDPTPKQVRQLCGISLPLLALAIGGVLWWKFATLTPMAILCGVLMPLGALGYLFPKFGRGLWITLQTIEYPIGWVVSHLILVVIYYGVFTPIGLLLRLSGHDPMHRRWNPGAKSYWEAYNPNRGARRYFRQY